MDSPAQDKELEYSYSPLELFQVRGPHETPPVSLKSFQPPSAPSAKRESFMSGVSHLSDRYSSEVAHQVSIKAVNQDVNPAVKYAVSPPQSVVDDESVISKNSSIKLGKLNTKTAPTQTVQPVLSYHTSIEGAVPPRSARRPKSEVVTTGNELAGDIEKYKQRHFRRHSKRLSLNITDDLDRLMASANTIGRLDERDEHSPLPQPTTSYQPTNFQPTQRNFSQPVQRNIQPTQDLALPVEPITPITPTGPDALASEVSSDAYETADNARSSRSLSRSDLGASRTSVPPIVPPRPSMENIKRARRVSKELQSGHTSTPGSAQTIVVPRPHEDFVEPDVPTQPPSRMVSQPRVMPDLRTKETTPVPALHRSTSGYSVIAPPGLSHENGSGSAQATVELPHLDRIDSPNTTIQEKSLPPSPVQVRVGAPEQAQLNSPSSLNYLDKAYRSTQLYNDETNASQTYQPQYPETSETPAQQEYTGEGFGAHVAQDDDYYDVEDPVLVSKPLKGKLVRENTKTHKKKPKRAKSKRVKRESAHSANSALKPFSYNTLINLLESINGTIIGEEFNQLNLPIKEKQLIEKIMDSLSRLTSDMVIDAARYEAGIERLEKAHRVLEGFL